MMRIRTLVVSTAAVLLATLGTLAPGSTAEARQVYTPSWHKVHFHLNAYQRHGGDLERGCSATWNHSPGTCKGVGETGLSAQDYPFNNGVGWQWDDQAHYCPSWAGRDHSHWRMEMLLRTWGPQTGAGSQLCGYMDHHWGTYRITQGKIWDSAHQVFRDVAATTGVVADREHVKGGPLFAFLGARDGGYVMGLRGWLYY